MKNTKTCKALLRRNYLSTTKGGLVQATCTRKAVSGSYCAQHGKSRRDEA